MTYSEFIKKEITLEGARISFKTMGFINRTRKKKKEKKRTS